MAIITNTFGALTPAVGMREDLQNVIFNIAPYDTDLVSGLKRRTATNRLHEWQTDTLASAITNNAVVEGDDLGSTFDAVTPTVRLGNRMQIARKSLIRSDTIEYVERAGRGSEKAYQLAKKGKELKRDMETGLFQNAASVAGSFPSTATTLAALGSWIRTNVDFGATGANPAAPTIVPAAGRTDGTQRAFTETILKNVLQLAWVSGAEIDNLTLYVGPVNKQKVSAFTGIATRTFDISKPVPAVTIAAADVYVGDFGTIKVKANRWMRERDGYLLDKSMLSLAFLRPIKEVALAKTGDADKSMLITEYTLCVHNEAAHGLAADLLTT